MKGAIFDLDGVIVDTAKYHYLAWRELAAELGFFFREEDNERLKGVSRMRSLEILLEVGGITHLTEEEKLTLATRKNDRYVEMLGGLDKSELLEGAEEYLLKLRREGVRIALGSASKNAPFILEKLGIASLFDAVVDGNSVEKAKPAPDVFLRGAEALGLDPADCCVFEDSQAGIEAARRAGCGVVAVDKTGGVLTDYDRVVRCLGDLLMRNEPAIVKRNRDAEHAMHACCNWGLFEQTKRKNKLLALLVTTDIHESPAQLTSAVDYLNYYDALDAGVCLGDIQASNFAKTDGSWYLNAIAHTQKPFMSIIGNHDVGNSFDPAISASAQKAYEKFIRPTDPLSGIEGRETPYFVKLFDKYKVALIGLDLYGDPCTVLENGKYAVQRGTHTLPQKEIDWLAKALAAIPAGYHLLLGMHSFPYDAEVTEGAWTQRGARLFYPSECPYGDDNLIPDMIDAWVKGGKLRAEYPPLDPAHLPTLTADCDFTARGEGIFAGYLVGHYHRDIQGTCKKYPYQNIIAFPATANDGWQNYCSDLPREKGTRAEDALTVVGVDTYNRRLKLVRIGSNITMDMTERKYHVVEY